MENILIKATDVNKSFGNNHVLKNISIEVNEGEVVSIIGPSGSGKSTLLRILTQLETADSGNIQICGDSLLEKKDGKNIYADPKLAHKMQLATGLVFQNFCLFPHMSILENITHPQINVLGIKKEQAIKTAKSLLSKMNLEDKENSYPFELSGGQKQRIAIARALALSPKVLFFDEPTSALDPELTGEILKVIKELSKENMTMVVVTHEMAFAKGIADKILFMDDGEVLESGTPSEVFDNPTKDRIKSFLKQYTDNSWED